MVQQIASLKTESAAPALPFTLSVSALSVQNETRQTFNNELLRQTGYNNVVKQSGQANQSETSPNATSYTQKTSTVERHNKPDKSIEPSAKQKLISHDKKENEPAAGRNSLDREDVVEEKIFIGDKSSKVAANGYSTQSTEDRELLKSKVDANSTSNNNLVDSSRDAQKNIVLESAEKSLSKEGSKITDFDYIDYVSSIAEFSGSEDGNNKAKQIDTDVLTTIKDSNDLQTDTETTNMLFDTKETLEKINRGSASESKSATVEKPAVINLADKPNEVTFPSNSSLLSANLSDQELFVDIENQHTKLANNNINSLESTEITAIVDDLIKQYETLHEDSSGITSSEFSDEDKTLLAELLLSSLQQSKENSKVLSEVQNKPTTIIPSTGVKNLLNEQENALDIQILTQEHNLVNAINPDVELVNVEEKGSLLATGKISQKAIQETAKQVEDNINTSVKDDKKLVDASNTLRNIAMLGEEQTEIALKDLSVRLQQGSTDVNREAKGNEFIAALQSGVKEFKQQLAQGREPNIDLKVLMADALAQISGESLAPQQPKIDAVLNQFNAVLNIANGVNPTVNLLESPLAGLADYQLAKEINIQHIEGTKLANGIQTQLNAQASTEKAINIFKQEGQQKLAEKVRWMVNSKNAVAEIRLDPPDLGGINIKVNLSGDTAQVSFNVQSAAAKEALDQAAPKLREMLEEQGIELGQSTVQQDSQSGNQNEPAGGNNLAPKNEETPSSDIVNNGENEELIVEQRISGNVVGGIDYYV